MADLPEWLQEFKENLIDTEFPASAHSSPDSDSERPTKVVQNQGSIVVFPHFPKDPHCEVCLRTRMTRAPCRRRTGEALPRAEKFGWLDNGWSQSPQWGGSIKEQSPVRCRGSRSCHQWIQSYPCKTKTSQKTEKSLRKFLEPSHKPKVIYTDNTLEFGKFCEDLSWNHRTSTPHRSETSGIAERTVRRVKEGTSAVLLQSRLDEKMVGWFHGMLLQSAKCPRPPGRRWKFLWKRADNSLWSNGLNIIRFNARINLARKNYLVSFLGMNWSREEKERRYSDCGFGRFGKVVRNRYSSSKNKRERSMNGRWYRKINCQEETTNSENPL